MRQRGERIERSFAHLYDTGAMRRTYLRGHTNILKRILIHAGGFNLGLVMRHLIGVGTPRGLQGRLAAAMAVVVALWALVEAMRIIIGGQPVDPRDAFTPSHRFELLPVLS
jgi:transposase